MTKEEMFDYLRSDYQKQFDKEVRTCAWETDEGDEFRTRYLVNKSHRLIFDERTHTAIIQNGEVLVIPKKHAELHGIISTSFATVEGRKEIVKIVREAMKNKEI